ncbi:MAG: heme ABC transporter ATP-binding protein [Chloroflexota bacterium]
MLRIEGLSASYGPRRVLRDITLHVQAGEVLALIGPNGAGKSTLVRAVSGVIPLDQGLLRTNGDDLAVMPPMKRARYLATVPQAISMPPAFTVWETVVMGRTPHLNFLGQTSPRDDAIVRSALERVDALVLAERRVGELSGGEQQRVLLARALAQDTPIMLLDEPNAHLDLQYQVALMTIIQQLAHDDGLAVLVALHDLNLAARYADRVALLVQGELMAMGDPADVLTGELISRAYQLPVTVVPHPLLDIPLVLPGEANRERGG